MMRTIVSGAAILAALVAGFAAAAPSVDTIKVTDGVLCTSRQVLTAHETDEIEVVKTPGTRILLAGSPSGADLWMHGQLTLLVRHVDVTGSTTQVHIFSPNQYCGNFQVAVRDVTDAFVDGVNFVSATLGGYYHSNGYYYGGLGPVHLVATSGHVASVTH